MGRAKDILSKFSEAGDSDLIKLIYAKFPTDMKDKRGGKNRVLIDVDNLKKAIGKDGIVSLDDLSSQELNSLAVAIGLKKGESLSEAAKPFSGLVGDFYYIISAPQIDTDKLTSTLPSQLEELKKIKNWKSNAKRAYIGAKYKKHEKAVADWVKEFGPKAYIVSWYKTDKNDSLEIFYI